ncbi:MAG: lysophospholipid acyltransferase family protein [Pseudoflavonifractor sp.]|nr:lysophospholipid acyltransferase family protein [Alloprevotella sp.]MCM1117645.1 lysophospholipid acyltransferase family protein [Pseudoflavonifractor sp.]
MTTTTKTTPHSSSSRLSPLSRWLHAPIEWALHGLALMPLKLLYPLVATPLYHLAYNIAGYRRKVVRQNLTESFPSLSESDRRQIERQFYRNFADYVVETIKLLHISDSEMRSRMTFEGIEVIDRLFDQGKSIVAYFSHTGNWEWAPSITMWTHLHPGQGADFCQVYRPLKDPWADQFFLRLRSRFHPLSFPKATVFRDLLRARRDGRLSITGFMSDQKPSHGDPTHIVEFLNHPTAMITGTETLARRLDMAVVYWDMTKPSRGHYHIKVELMTEGGDALKALPPMALTADYARRLEQTILRDPAIWLWTHRRWKIPVTLPSAHDPLPEEDK